MRISYKKMLPTLAGVILLASNISAANESVDYYSQKAFEAELSELKDEAELCKILSDRGCTVLEYVLAPNIDKKKLDGDDKQLLGEVMNITPDSAGKAKRGVVGDIRLKIVRNAAITLGVSIAVAYESSRYNRLWERYSPFYDKIMRFEALMMDSDVGQIIVPAVISQADNYSTTIEQGRTFRAAGKVYRIVRQPFFSHHAPSWKDYLKLDYDRPKIPSASVLPTSDSELEVFRTYLVKGFVTGVDVVESRAEEAYERMLNDFNGMSLYHVLLNYEMVSLPEVETNYSAVAVNRDGNEMSLDDTIMRIKIHPRLDGNRNKWKALPKLQEFDLNVMDSKFSSWGER